MKGASEYMIDASDNFHKLLDNEILPIDDDLHNKLRDGINQMASQALRTLGFCYKTIDINEANFENANDNGIFNYETSGFTLIGFCGIKDVIKPEVPESVNKCFNAGINVKMVTGDNKLTAKAIAEEVNIINDNNRNTAIVMEGPEFMRLVGGIICENCIDKNICDCVRNKAELELPENKGKKIKKEALKDKMEFRRIYKNLAVLSRSRPEDKYALVIGLLDEQNVVAVTGDGTNDAPALSKASIGFCMNIAGTEIAKDAADILIMDDNFSSLVQAVKWGRNIYDSI